MKTLIENSAVSLTNEYVVILFIVLVFIQFVPVFVTKA